MEPGSIEHLTQIISQVVGPSFLLGSVAAFITMLFARMSAVIERIRSLNAIPESGDERSRLRADVPRLIARTRLLRLSIQLSIISGIVTTMLIITAFASAFLRLQHVWGSAVLFVIALLFFFAALVVLAVDVSRSLSEHDHF